MMVIEKTLISRVIEKTEHVPHFLHLLHTSPLFSAHEAHLHAHLTLLFNYSEKQDFLSVSPNLESGTHLSTHAHTHTHTH
ncbi:hypothetical protein E2C01_034993 [Portunus trituberculatus]|uniref:Uncharacterized protein n=1 Tax=Portunus trituberculatus TaxID=210409 RepID=A0A5B7F8I5_PORTR|nr:hypothetical protein [Portunus trituberculatus]